MAGRSTVWLLDVEMKANTATVEGDFKRVALTARRAFVDMGDSAKAGTDKAKKGLFDVRHGLGLVDNVMRGQHSQAMADMVREFQNSSIVMTALPFAAVAAGIALIGGIAYEAYEHLEQMKEAQEKVNRELEKIGTSSTFALMRMDDQLLKAGEKTDDLTNNHLAALNKELELIKNQNLEGLAQQLASLDAPVKTLLKDLKRSWYEMGIGSAGAQHALDQATASIQSLLSQGDEKGALDKAKGTLAQWQKVLDAMQEVRSAKGWNKAQLAGAQQDGQALLVQEAYNTLKKYNLDADEKEYKSQVAIVGLMQDKVAMIQKAIELEKQQTHNAHLQYNAKYAHPDWHPSLIAKAHANLTGNPEAQQLQVLRQSVREREHEYQRAAQNGAELVRSSGALRIEAEKQQFALEHSLRQATMQQQIAEDVKLADEEYNIKLQALKQQQIAAMAGGEKTLNQLRALQDKERQLVQQHEDQITAIKERAEISRNQKIQRATQQEQAIINQGLVQSIMRHQTWGSTITQIGNQVVSSMMSVALKHVEANAMTKASDAKAAAASAFKHVMSALPFPADVITAPIVAAGTFASVMAFDQGTDSVPGVGRGDVVPAMLSPGEGVVPGGVMEGLRGIARRGGFEANQQPVHFHHTSHYHVQALDQHGVRRVLEEHSDEFEQHFHHVMRKRHA